MNSPIAILGAGNMAGALALDLARHKRPVRLYCIEPDVEEEMRVHHHNTKYLTGHRFPKNVTATNDLATVLDEAEDVFIAVPSFALIEVLLKARPFLSSGVRTIACVTKGLDARTLKPLVIAGSEILPPKLRRRMCMLGGPAIATEMAKGSLTGFEVAGRDAAAIARVKHLLESGTVRCAVSSDLLGVGLASALKNPYAIGLGLCDGLAFATNTKALVLTLAMQETQQILTKAGAHPETAITLAGLGDMVVTAMSPHGRNRTYGARLAGAKSKDPKRLGLGTVEGIAATALAIRLARRLKARTPLLEAIDRCLRSRKNFEQPFVNYLKNLKLS